MSHVMKLLDTLPQTWRGLITIASAVGAGATFGFGANALFGKARDIPIRVEALEAGHVLHSIQIDSIRGKTAGMEKKMDRILCYAESQAGVRSVSDCIR